VLSNSVVGEIGMTQYRMSAGYKSNNVLGVSLWQIRLQRMQSKEHIDASTRTVEHGGMAGRSYIANLHTPTQVLLT